MISIKLLWGTREKPKIDQDSAILLNKDAELNRGIINFKNRERSKKTRKHKHHDSMFAYDRNSIDSASNYVEQDTNNALPTTKSTQNLYNKSENSKSRSKIENTSILVK